MYRKSDRWQYKYGRFFENGKYYMKKDQTKKKILALIMSMTIAAGLAGCAADTDMNSSANGETVETYADPADTAVKSEENIGNENHYETAYEITDWNTADLLNDLTVFGAGFINDGHIAQQEAENSEKYMIESSYSDYLDQTYSCIRNKDEKEFTFIWIFSH